MEGTVGHCGSCVWIRLISDASVDWKDANAVANPTAIYSKSLSHQLNFFFFYISLVLQELPGDCTCTSLSSIFTLVEKLYLNAAVWHSSSWPTSRVPVVSSQLSQNRFAFANWSQRRPFIPSATPFVLCLSNCGVKKKTILPSRYRQWIIHIWLIHYLKYNILLSLKRKSDCTHMRYVLGGKKGTKAADFFA